MAQTLAQSLTATIAVTLAATRAVGAANGDRVLDPGEGLAHGCHRRRDTLHLPRAGLPTDTMDRDQSRRPDLPVPTDLLGARHPGAGERARDAAVHRCASIRTPEPSRPISQVPFCGPGLSAVAEG